MSLSKEKMFRADTSGISRSILIFKDFKIDELRWLRRLVLCYAARYAGFISTFYTAPHPRYFLLMISYMESNSFFFYGGFLFVYRKLFLCQRTSIQRSFPVLPVHRSRVAHAFYFPTLRAPCYCSWVALLHGLLYLPLKIV